jgi:para-aminobenzoate synthetase component 1
LRTTFSYTVPDIPAFKLGLLQWAQQFEEAVWLDSNGHHDVYGSFEGILAVEALTALVTDHKNAFAELKEYQKSTRDWLFGYLSYDLKNNVEQLSSSNFDGLGFADLHFFQPKRIIRLKQGRADFIYLNMVSDEIQDDINAILAQVGTPVLEGHAPQMPVQIRLRMLRDDYCRRVQQMLGHIQRGDIYEANFCQEFYAEQASIDPVGTFTKLNAISQSPFATFLKLGGRYALSASPERYLKKQGAKIISQPIKGTARRSQDPLEDEQLRIGLANDEKERAENIMIVDLVRNDLSKSALRGSVTVEELCRVYPYRQVHQMISTVTALVGENKNPVEILEETFPMGSMTGAPKLSAMKIIEALECTKRGLYSGSVGYFAPNDDFDFNVIIRSILYNASTKYVSFSVGSAITAKASPEREYEECLLKARAMREVLEGWA